jgi:AAA domain (dynein-related subfamily)
MPSRGPSPFILGKKPATAVVAKGFAAFQSFAESGRLVMSNDDKQPKAVGGPSVQITKDKFVDDHLFAGTPPPTYCIPQTAFVQPCLRIEEEAHEHDEHSQRLTIRQRYKALLEPMPLAGALAMKRVPSGQLAVIATLRREAPWFEPVIASIELQLEIQLMLGRPWLSFRPILLLGEPGVGKSWLARRLAELTGVGSGIADLAGGMDGAIIHGNPRGWLASQPCFPALIMNQTMTANPVCIVEELDKSGGSTLNGDPIASLLGLIEPGSARAYYDKCLLSDVDVSHVNWIMTANSLTPRLPTPFLSRLEVIDVPLPDAAMFDAILDGLLAGLVRRWDLPAALYPELPSQAVRTLRADFAKHRSIRRLSQMVERIAGLCFPEPHLH